MQYGLNSPLKTNMIYDIHFAKNDLLYIATDNGLWSYNGLSFKQYDAHYPMVTPKDVTSIQEDKNQRIYIQDFSGNLFYIQNDSLTKDTTLNSYNFKLKSYLIKKNYTYYLSSSKIYSKEHHTGIIEELSYPNVDTWRGITDAGFLAGYSDVALSASLKNYQLSDNQIIPINDTIGYVDQVNFYNEFEQEYAYYKNNSLFNNIDSLLVRLPNLTPSKIKKINNKILVACKEGLHIPSLKSTYLKNFHVTELLLDNEKNLWASTINGGLFKIINLNYLIFPNKSLQPFDYVFVNQKKIICSTLTGNLYHWDSTTTQFVPLGKHKNQVKNIIYSPIAKEYIVSGNNELIFDSKLDLKVTRDGYGPIFLDSNQLYKIRNPSSLFYSEYHAFFKQRKKLYYIKSNDLFNVQVDSNKVLYFRFNKKKSIVAINKWKNIVLAVINDTLTFVDTHKKFKTEAVHFIPNVQKSYVKNNRLFIATPTTILEFDPQGNLIGEILRKNGLEYNITTLSVNDKYLAISTQEAIYLLDAYTFEPIQKFTPQNGITSIDFTRGWLYNGNLYVNGNKGVSQITLDGNYNKGKPSLGIASITIDDSTYTHRIFTHDQNNIQVNFAVRSYTAQGKLYWKINNNKWSILHEGTTIQFNELQANDYTIEAYFENDLGIRTPSTKCTFTISPPYWQTWWFYTLLNLIGIGILSLLWKQRLASKQKEAQQQNQVNILRIQALQTQMNPHFIFNVQAAIQGLWLEEKDEAALELQTNFSKLLRKIFQYSGQPSISIEQLLDFLENYISLELIRFEDAVEIDWQIDGSLFEEDYSIPPLLIQPIIENSFKHGLLHKKENRKLILELKNQSPYLYATITDNGIGRSITSSNTHRSSGLKTTQERLNILQQSVIKQVHPFENIKITDLKTEDQQNLGTKVELWVPFVDF